jgi:hypothetical protein
VHLDLAAYASEQLSGSYVIPWEALDILQSLSPFCTAVAHPNEKVVPTMSVKGRIKAMVFKNCLVVVLPSGGETSMLGVDKTYTKGSAVPQTICWQSPAFLPGAAGGRFMSSVLCEMLAFLKRDKAPGSDGNMLLLHSLIDGSTEAAVSVYGVARIQSYSVADVASGGKSGATAGLGK